MTGPALFSLPLTCRTCGAPVRLVQSVSTGTDATAVARCTACPAEWVVSVTGREAAPGRLGPGAMPTGEVSPTADGADRTLVDEAEPVHRPPRACPYCIDAGHPEGFLPWSMLSEDHRHHHVLDGGAHPESVHAVGYVRVSTREQAESGGSLDGQRQAIEVECARRGWHLAGLLEDAGASGKNMKRPGLASALQQLETGAAGVLVAAKLDRLSRSVLDFAALVELSRRQGWALVVLDVGADTSTPAGEMLVNVMAAFAQYERRLIGQRTRDGLAVKRAQGVRLGRPPMVPADIVKRIRRERAAGRSLQKIAGGLTADRVPTAHGGARWYPSTVRYVLGQPAG